MSIVHTHYMDFTYINIKKVSKSNIEPKKMLQYISHYGKIFL